MKRGLSALVQVLHEVFNATLRGVQKNRGLTLSMFEPLKFLKMQIRIKILTACHQTYAQI